VGSGPTEKYWEAGRARQHISYTPDGRARFALQIAFIFG
jgi:hypothetical protein